MPRRIDVHRMVALCVATVIICAAPTAQAQDKPLPRLKVRLVTASQLTAPVAELDAGVSPEAERAANATIEAEPSPAPVDITVPAPQQEPQPGQRDDVAASLFEALVSSGWSSGGFDGPASIDDAAVDEPSTNADIPASLTVEPATADPGVSSPDPLPFRRVPGSLSPAGAGSDGDYLLGPGDVIEVFVWRNSELTREVPVRPDGRISLPLVGEVVASGKSVATLQQEVTAALSQYVQMPTVTVSVKQIRSLVVYVLGNVTKPGPVQMERSLTALQAIAMAGGLNDFADRKDIVVLRTDENGVHQRWSFRYDDVVAGRNLETNLSLRAGDVIYVP